MVSPRALQRCDLQDRERARIEQDVVALIRVPIRHRGEEGPPVQDATFPTVGIEHDHTRGNLAGLCVDRSSHGIPPVRRGEQHRSDPGKRGESHADDIDTTSVILDDPALRRTPQETGRVFSGQFVGCSARPTGSQSQQAAEHDQPDGDGEERAEREACRGQDCLSRRRAGCDLGPQDGCACGATHCNFAGHRPTHLTTKGGD
jgi:hypothetical protein